MEPKDALWTDRDTFESELDDFIDSVKSESTSSTSRKRSAAQEPLSKRIKTETITDASQPLTDYSLHVYPSRKVLLDRPKAPNVKQGDSGVGGSQSQVSHNPDAARRSSSGESNSTASHPEFDVPNPWYDPSLKSSVRRQRESWKDVQGYETLRGQSRREKLLNVDRYIPSPDGTVTTGRKTVLTNTWSPHAMGRKRLYFPLERLPDDLRSRIFELLLVSPEPITVDFYWLRSFVKGHSRTPIVTQRIEIDGATYNIPVS